MLPEARKLLTTTNLHDLKALQHVVILKDTATAEQALKVLANFKILSAPVVVAPSEGQVGAQFPPEQTASDILGFIDIRDILSSFLQCVDLEAFSKMKLLQRMRYLESAGLTFSHTRLKDLAVMGGDGDFLHVTQARCTLAELIEEGLLHPKRKGMHEGRTKNDIVHRIALFDSESKITNIISQTDIIRFLLQHADELNGLPEKTVEELGWAKKPVVSVSPDKSALEAMALMQEKSISAVAVTNAAGKLIGNFSISEMRTIMAEHFGALALPVAEFLALEHGTEFAGYTRMETSPERKEVEESAGGRFAADRGSRFMNNPGEEVGQSLIITSVGTTLFEVMDLLVKHRIHRVYVVDESLKPVGIITCTDVLRRLMQ